MIVFVCQLLTSRYLVFLGKKCVFFLQADSRCWSQNSKIHRSCFLCYKNVNKVNQDKLIALLTADGNVFIILTNKHGKVSPCTENKQESFF